MVLLTDSADMALVPKWSAFRHSVSSLPCLLSSVYCGSLGTLALYKLLISLMWSGVSGSIAGTVF